MNTYRKMAEYLSVRGNWTPLLLYVARSFLVLGVIIGFVMGADVAVLVMLALHK